MWLVGYDYEHKPLSDVTTSHDFMYLTLRQKEMFEDIMGDYANKTVTMEKHPHQGIHQLSIHPCKHASAMKHLIDIVSKNGGKLKIHQAMFIFLKFISSVVPTMEYDFTVDMSLE